MFNKFILVQILITSPLNLILSSSHFFPHYIKAFPRYIPVLFSFIPDFNVNTVLEKEALRFEN